MPVPPNRLSAGLATLVALVGVGSLLAARAEAMRPAMDSGRPAATSLPLTAHASASMPRYRHVVVAVFENRSRHKVVAGGSAFRTLARRGADMRQSYAVTHPSEPNYLALFSGRTRVVDDSCPHRWHAPNLASQLLNRGYSFRSYAEGLPAAGSMVCATPNGQYARKHAPWTNFTTVPRRLALPYNSVPKRFGSLPTLSFVIPSMCHDMHDCPVTVGNRWLRDHLLPYAVWARTHDSLLMVTFDEDDDSPVANHIYTVLAGAHIAPGRYRQRIDHYSVLRTLEDLFGVRALGHAADARPIRSVWR